MLEILCATSVVALVLVVGFFLLYLLFAKAWITRSAREAAVCLATSSPLHECRARLRKTLEVGLPFGRFEIEECRRDHSQSSVVVELRVDNKFVRLATDQADDVPNDHVFASLRAKSSIPRRL